MRIYEKLVCEDIGRRILDTLYLCKEEFIEDADTKAVEILEDIKSVLLSDLSESEMIEKIIGIYNKNNLISIKKPPC